MWLSNEFTQRLSIDLKQLSSLGSNEHVYNGILLILSESVFAFNADVGKQDLARELLFRSSERQ